MSLRESFRESFWKSVENSFRNSFSFSEGSEIPLAFKSYGVGSGWTDIDTDIDIRYWRLEMDQDQELDNYVLLKMFQIINHLKWDIREIL